MEQQHHGLGAPTSESDAVKAPETPTPPHEAAQGPAYQLDSGVEREVQAESASTAEPELATPDDAPCIDSSSNSGEMSVNCTAVWSAEQFASLDEAPSCETPASEPEINSAAPEQENEGGGRDSGDVDALLGRLVRAGLWRSDEASASAPAKELEQPSSPPREITIRQAAKQPYAEQALPAQDVSEEPLEQPTYAQTASISDEEESIESYMERLMKRVRGDAPPGPVVRDPVVETPPPPAVAVEPVPEAKQPAEEESDNYCPRRTAPELVTNLSAMRELANTAARSAIDRHVRQHTGKQAAGKLVGAGLTIAASGLVGYWALRANSLPACVAAFIGGCAGCYWTLAAFKRLSTLRRLNQLSARETPKSQPGSSSPPAAG
jgi:hypothetical protein